MTDPSELTLPILYEDHRILAVNKPSGLHSQHQESKPDHQSAEALVKKRSEKWILLHRLDFGTSGVLLFTSDATRASQIRDLFRTRSIGKFYRALVHGSLPETTPFQIDLPIAHHPKNQKKMVAVPPDRKLSFRGNPRPALTTILSGRRFEAPLAQSTDPMLSELSLQIATGVTHQIRVHLAQLKLPIVNDPIYGIPGLEFKDPSWTWPRLGLHCEKMELTLEGNHYCFEAPLPWSL